MASDLNKVILIGRLVKDPELRYTQSGTSVASFSIANNRNYNTSTGEKKEDVSFFNCVAWSKKGEVIVQYCKKGQRIGLEGRLQQRVWEDKEGNKRYNVEVVLENFQFLDSKANIEDESASFSSKNTTKINNEVPIPNDNPFSDNDIPF